MDEAEFDDFYTSSRARVTAQVYAMIGDRDEAQECVQEAYARAWSHRRRLDRAEHPEAWVRTVAYRLARKAQVKTARRQSQRAVSRAEPNDPLSVSPDTKHGEFVENEKLLTLNVPSLFTISDVAKLNTYVVNFKSTDLSVIREVRSQFFPQENLPASALVGVQALAMDGLLIEVEAIATVKE